MLKQWQFMLLMALSVVSLILVLTNIALFSKNRDAQTEFTNRAQYIQQSQQLEPLYQGIVRSLAEIAAKTNDQQIGQLLTAQGITYSVNQQPQGAAEAPKEAKGKAK